MNESVMRIALQITVSLLRFTHGIVEVNDVHIPCADLIHSVLEHLNALLEILQELDAQELGQIVVDHVNNLANWLAAQDGVE